MRAAPVVLYVGLLTGLACQHPLAPSEQLVPPPCSDPAPLLGKFDPRAPGYIVAYHDSVDAQLETARLATAYGFVPTHVYQFAIRGFSADLAPEVVANMRCEATVRLLEYDSFGFTTT
jgi:hypothetical protein